MMATSYELARCIVCGRADAATVATEDDILREVEILWEFHVRRLDPEIPAERLIDRVTFSQRPAIRLVRCRECGLIYRNPRERAFELSEIYGRAETDPASLAALYRNQRAAFRAQARELTRVHRGPGRGLEVGCYVGAFLGAAGDAGWSFEGIDIAEGVVEFARGRGHAARRSSLDREIDAGGAYDAVAIWNTFEQLDDPRPAAMGAARLLRPGGVFAVRVPNGAFYARWRPRMDGRLGALARAALAHNNLLGFPYRHGFTVGSLTRLLSETGFEIRRVRGDVLVPIADRYTRWWSAAEERVVKSALRAAARFGGRAAASPWIEMYGIRR